MENSIKVNFVLPFKPRRPAGGFRVMYEYADRLSRLGYSVHLTYPIKTQFMQYRLPYWVRFFLYQYIEGFRTNRWFDFNPDITMSFVPSVKEKYIKDADFVFVTWWTTALEVGQLSPSKGKKINLIQGFENWEGREEMLYLSYNIPETLNIVVASYLKEIVSAHSNNRIELIPNAVDKEQYKVMVDIEKKPDFTICMNYSEQEIKGSKYGLEALHIVKEKYPELKVDLFGVYPEPHGLPEWMTYHRAPSNLVEIYNRNSIFISNSLTEGFGLVSVEALFCGCALVCTDIAGHKEYAKDKETALLVEPQNPQDMADKIIFLIENPTGRIELAKRGNEYVQRFSWDKAVEKMDNLLKELIAEKQR